jgi:hypothetical protein
VTVASATAILARSLLALAPAAGAPREAGLQAGDAFTVSVKYSNVWNELALAVKGPPGTIPVGIGSLNASVVASDRIQASRIGADPLFVDMSLHVEARGAGRFAITPRVAGVRYFDDRSRRWSFEPAARGSNEAAEKIIKDVSAQWRTLFPTGLETEMLEEQLLGAAICLLSGEAFEASFSSWDADPELCSLDEAIRRKLPRDFPVALHKSVAWFFREAMARVIARAPDDLRRNVGFDARGVPYTVKDVRVSNGRPVAETTGQMHWTSTGAFFKESSVVDQLTGVVIESKSITTHDVLRGHDARFGAVRWETKLIDFKPAKATAVAK